MLVTRVWTPSIATEKTNKKENSHKVKTEQKSVSGENEKCYPLENVFHQEPGLKIKPEKPLKCVWSESPKKL